MKKNNKKSKRLLALVLSFAMMLTMVPTTLVEAAFTDTDGDYVYEDEGASKGDSYISLPITIRDYAADGMLFECNEFRDTGNFSVDGTAAPTTDFYEKTLSLYPTSKYTQSKSSGGILTVTATSYTSGGALNYDVSSLSMTENRYLAIRYKISSVASGCTPTIQYMSKGTQNTLTGDNAWHAVVLDMGTDTGTFWRLKIAPYLPAGATMQIDYIAAFSTIAEAKEYKSNNGVVTGGTVYNYGNTAGFGLLETTSASHYNALADGIEGTEKISNGTWNAPSATSSTATLNSGATQTVYGAYIRTNLVEAKLDENKNLIYTEPTVDYLADYLKVTLAENWQASDGSYNLWYVMGEKMFDSNYQYVGVNSTSAVNDLASVLRHQITSDGTYADAKTAYESGQLDEYSNIDSYYDAAYFLLHNTFNDNTGYGMTIDEYSTLNMVEKVDSDGNVYYTFNSAYDDAVYDTTNGVIYNNQVTKVTSRKAPYGNSGETDPDGLLFTRGNIQTQNTFNPIVNLGYGLSGSDYVDYYSLDSSNTGQIFSQKYYYKDTNYNLTLEGHAQFIYYQDDDLFFTFTGDDDVYLYINGTRVLDLGGAHATSKASINLNDVAALCGLKDGQSYDFDFYYMERHGTAANFGIETNIKIVDPSMTTTKTGYQNGKNTGYNGYISPLVPVTYEFALQNNGEADISELTFKDEDIDVTLTKDSIKLNDETYITDLSATVYNADGTVKTIYSEGNVTEENLKALLSSGLAVGEKIVIYGFNYTVTADDWTEGKNTFTNVVYTTAVSYGENTSARTLNGMAQWMVQKSEYDIEDYHVYEWSTKSVELTKSDLLAPVESAIEGFDATSATITLCSASGATTGTNINTKAVLSDSSITYTSTETGADTFYYKVTQGTVEVVIGVTVYSYDVADNTYVLDYGLAVELNGEEFGLMVNDTLELSANPNATTAKVTGIEEEKTTNNYGDFTWEDPSLKYTPNDIIDNIDSTQVNVQVLEDGATELTKFTGVEMYETVTTAPANVVYYEENFPGITYVSTDENQWVHYETVDEEGNSMAGTEQSADQDSNYGSDPNYSEDVSGEWNDGDIIESTTFQLDTSDLDSLQQSGIEKLNEYLGYMTGQDSNGTVNALVVNKTAEVMYFDFVGTGFEIISRTTDEQYAVINVIVYLTDGDGNIIVNEEGSDSANADLPYTNKNGVVTQKPVITESKGGDLYQVPIISITGLPKANYRVSVKAAGSTETKTRVLYIDGIRIYGPLSDEEALEYYNPEEYQAEFLEIKQLIGEGKAIYADASDTDDELQLVTGTTLIEDVDAAGVLTSISSVDEYMKVGPNNEIYLDSTVYGMIAFWVTPDEDTPESARTIEIGAHRKSDSSSELDGVVTMAYGSTAEDIIEGTYTYEIASGTEQYYTIDVNNLPKNNAGKYLVLIGINDSENIIEALALTNLKVSGYEISFAETAIQTAAEEGDVKDEPMVNEIVQVYNARNIIVEPEEEVVEVPVNENLSISSAALRATSIVSGKSAILTLKANAAAEDVVITDANGDSVELTKCTRKVSGDVATFTVMWTVTGSRGDSLNYTTRVYDADGLASVNAETVTVTIK